MKVKFTSTYKNWMYFMLPLIFFLLLELYFNWPYNHVVPGSEGVYIQSSVLYIGIYVFAALIGLGINFWHYRKMKDDKLQRKMHMIICVVLLCLNYIPGKLLIMGSTMSKDSFIAATGFTRVNFRVFDKTQSIVFLLYFLLQAFFALYSIARKRAKTNGTVQNGNNQ
ncbi:MAG TPA: hypothetical protein VFZ42_01225 [Chitinophagaceae bacterium]